jgi:hypothetical protein
MSFSPISPARVESPEAMVLDLCESRLGTRGCFWSDTNLRSPVKDGMLERSEERKENHGRPDACSEPFNA